MQHDLGVTFTLAILLAWLTLGLVALMVLSLLILRWARWRRAPGLASLEAEWGKRLMACALGDPVAPVQLAYWQRWTFLKLWLHAQMSLQGACRNRLAALGQAMGCEHIALRKAHSPHRSERMVGMLALGFLGQSQHAPWLIQRLFAGGNQEVVYAGRALLEINEHDHADNVVQALLSVRRIDMSLASVVFKPFRATIAAVLLRKPPTSCTQESLRWLHLALAIRAQIPTHSLLPFLMQDENIECLIAAIRLVMGEDGVQLVASQAQHSDWRVRAQAALKIGSIGGAAELPVLTRLLTDEAWWVRYRATQSLRRLPGVSADRVLEIAQKTQDPYALNMALAVIAEVGGDR